MQSDYQIVSGQTAPIFEDQLTFSNGKAAEPEAVTFVMRSPTANEPLKLHGTSTVVSKGEGKVSFTPSALDTAKAGSYLACWEAQISGVTMTFPTEGYLWVQIQESIGTSGGATLVGLPEVKSYLNIQANDRTRDDRLNGYIAAVRPVIENITGPILPTVYREYYDGGNYFISLRRRPSTTFGTNPVFVLMACSEYRGPIEYPLSIIQNPSEGTIYSCMFHGRQGIVERRTSGGGVMAFPKMSSAVHVVYEAGQEAVPPNVQEAALEIIRVSYQSTQAVGSGRQTVADVEEFTNPYGGLFIPRRARELLQPNRRGPSIF